MFNRTRSIFQVQSKRKEGHITRLHANDLGEAVGFVSESAEVADEA